MGMLGISATYLQVQGRGGTRCNSSRTSRPALEKDVLIELAARAWLHLLMLAGTVVEAAGSVVMPLHLLRYCNTAADAVVAAGSCWPWDPPPALVTWVMLFGLCSVVITAASGLFAYWGKALTVASATNSSTATAGKVFILAAFD